MNNHNLDTKQLNAVVRLDVTISEPDFISPWQNSEQHSVSGSGVVIEGIEGNHILTNAHNITNATFISVSKSSSDEVFEAHVAAVDHDCDLALVDVADASFFNDIEPMSIGITPPVRSEVQVAGYPLGGVGMSITQGIISRIEERAYAHSSYELLTAQLDAAINPGNSGGPVIAGGEIAGIAFQGRRDGEGLGYMIPTEIIHHFLFDVCNDHIRGVPSLFFKYFRLTNQDMRRALKMRRHDSGVLVYNVAKQAKSNLRDGDVLLAINDTTISNNGNIWIGDDETYSLKYLLYEKQVGQEVEFRVLRDGKELVLRQRMVKLPYCCQNIRESLPEYYITGGLVFTALSENLLSDLCRADLSFLPFGRPLTPIGESLKKFRKKFATFPGEEQVILQTVLNDKVNTGLHGCSLEPVSEVNGVPVRNLRHLAKLVDDCRDGVIIIKLEDGLPIMLDAKKLREATPRILKRYRVPSDRYLRDGDKIN